MCLFYPWYRGCEDFSLLVTHVRHILMIKKMVSFDTCPKALVVSELQLVWFHCGFFRSDLSLVFKGSHYRFISQQMIS